MEYENVLLIFSNKWMELENIILKAQKTRNSIYYHSYANFRSRANTAMWWDLGHIIRGEHIWEVWG
jgi:hypothetical protein